MHKHKFDPKQLDKLKNPERLERENPDAIWESLLLTSPDCIVDIGCGVGYAAIPFAKKIPDGKVYACDISREMLDALAEEIDKSGVKNVSPVEMEEVKVSLDDGIADCVLMQNLYHELENVADSLNECKRLLKVGGKIAVIDWKKGKTPAGPPVEIRVEAEQIESDLRKAGYWFITNIDILPYHNFFVAVKT